jgi:rsbT antagonist protein RsbS
MEAESDRSGVTMHITRGCLVVSIQMELYDEALSQIQKDVLERVETTGVKGVIIDVSGIEIIDAYATQVLFDSAKMISLLGATAILTGLSPGVAASLVDLDVNLWNLRTALNLEDALNVLEPLVNPEAAHEGLESNGEVSPGDEETDTPDFGNEDTAGEKVE